MIYTENTKKAMKIMFDAHKEQVDKGGVPYVFHPWHVAEQMMDEASTIVALLHDVVEDTDMTIEDMKSYDFDSEIIDALATMTHPQGVDYYEYIKNVAQNELATKVKIEDLKHNLDDSRLEVITDKINHKRDQYKASLNFLRSVQEEAEAAFSGDNI